MNIVTAWQFSNHHNRLLYSDENIEKLIAKALEELGLEACDVINIQVDGTPFTEAWSVRVFCRKN